MKKSGFFKCPHCRRDYSRKIEDPHKHIEGCPLQHKNPQEQFRARQKLRDFKQKCKNCGHTKGDHYTPVIDPDFESNSKTRAGVCKKEDCRCSKFEPTKN